MPNLAETIRQLAFEAGGPGSGRRPSSTEYSSHSKNALVMKNYHNDMAEHHDFKSDIAKTDKEGKQHNDAANAHQNAAKAWGDVARSSVVDKNIPARQKEAGRLSDKADRQSDKLGATKADLDKFSE